MNGKERQNYPVSDMIFSPARLVSLISRDMTLFPGDVISCGTSVGAGPIPRGATVEVVIEGIGSLSNRTMNTPEHGMKIAVVGAGAIGGYVGGWLAAAGEEVTFIARGANLAAIGRTGCA